MREAILSLLSGFLFSIGLALSGMTQPKKVMGFLDVFGSWDPSLLFVMVGAIAVYAVAYRLILRRTKPILAESFQIPAKKELDRKLLFGSAVFGAGWGLAGFCPGPALTSLMSFQRTPLIFVMSMLFGMFCYKCVQRRKGT